MKNFPLLVLVFCLFGCHTAIKTIYGIKKPKLEDEHSVKKYLLRKGIDTSQVYFFRNLKSFAIGSEQNMLNIPEAMFFNKAGYLVRYKRETVDCNAHVNDFILDLSHFSTIEPDKSISMDHFLSLLTIEKPIEKADINVFITWTVYAGKLNKEKAFEWIRLLDIAKAKGLQVNYYLVNCDYMKSWNIPKDARKKLGIKN